MTYWQQALLNDSIRIIVTITSALILVLPYPVKDYEYYEKYYDEMAVLLLASISGTIAYIQVHSHISNSFTVAKLSIELNETFDGKDKTNVTVENTEINGVFGEMTFVGGVATFVLKHGESKTATGLPSGITYSVTEAEANRDGYTTVASKASGSIIKNDTVTVAFTNTKNSNISEGSDHPNVPSKPSTPTNSPETGDTLNLRLWTSVMGVSLGRADYLSGSCEKEQLSWQTDEIIQRRLEIPSHALIWFTIIASKRRI